MSRRLFKVFRKTNRGKTRQVRPTKWGRKNKSARYDRGAVIRDRLRRRGIKAWMRAVAQPAWKTHLTGPVQIPKSVPRQVKRNARRLRAKVGRAFKRAGRVGRVTSFVRTRAQQEALFAKYGPGKAAVPGTSFHELGLAMDVADDDGDTGDGRHAIERELKAEGLHTPISHEDWHITEDHRWG